MAAPFALVRPETLPTNILFPEAYAKSKRMVAMDFVFFGITTVTAVLLGAVIHLAIVG